MKKIKNLKLSKQEGYERVVGGEYLAGLLIKIRECSEEDKALDRPSPGRGGGFSNFENEEEGHCLGSLGALRITFCRPSIVQSSKHESMNPNPQ